jgi:hypothetical protein
MVDMPFLIDVRLELLELTEEEEMLMFQPTASELG